MFCNQSRASGFAPALLPTNSVCRICHRRLSHVSTSLVDVPASKRGASAGFSHMFEPERTTIYSGFRVSQPQPVALATVIGRTHLYSFFRAEKQRRGGQNLGKFCPALFLPNAKRGPFFGRKSGKCKRSLHSDGKNEENFAMARKAVAYLYIHFSTGTSHAKGARARTKNARTPEKALRNPPGHDWGGICNGVSPQSLSAKANERVLPPPRKRLSPQV